MRNKLIPITTAGIGAFVSFLYGEITPAFVALCFFMAVDFITGILNGIIYKKLNSKTCYKGIIKKVNILALVAVGHFIDQACNINTAQNIITFFYLGNEGISIIENAAKAGLPIPQKLIDILEQLKEGGEK